MARQISNGRVLYDWLARTHDPIRRETLLTWTRAACIDPDAVTHGTVQKPPPSRRALRYASVPGAAATVFFLVFDTPVKVLHLVRIYDDPGLDEPTLWVEEE